MRGRVCVCCECWMAMSSFFFEILFCASIYSLWVSIKFRLWQSTVFDRDCKNELNNTTTTTSEYLLAVLVFPYARCSHQHHRSCTLSYGIAERWVISGPAGCFRFDCTLYVCGNFVEWLVTSFFFCAALRQKVVCRFFFLLLFSFFCAGYRSFYAVECFRHPVCVCSSQSINKNKNTLFNVSFMNKFTLVAGFMRLK